MRPHLACLLYKNVWCAENCNLQFSRHHSYICIDYYKLLLAVYSYTPCPSTLNHKLQLQPWLVPEKMFNYWYIFKILQDAEKIFYPVTCIILLWSFFQRYVGFTASIALCNLKLIITRSWHGAHFLVPRINSELVVRTARSSVTTFNQTHFIWLIRKKNLTVRVKILLVGHS